MRRIITKRELLYVAIALIIAIPASAGAAHIFTDVSDSNTHATGIEWVADAGVTAGCGDGTTYCPDDAVNRAQMATFMHRLSGNATGVAPSVAAATAEEADTAANADDADNLDGLDSSEFRTTTIRPLETVYGTIGGQGQDPTGGLEYAANASLPAPAPFGLSDEYITVAGWDDDTDGACTGTVDEPTAEPGYVCIYPYSVSTVDSAEGYVWGGGDGQRFGFQLSWFTSGIGTNWMFGTWAYTAPVSAPTGAIASGTVSAGGGN